MIQTWCNLDCVRITNTNLNFASVWQKLYDIAEAAFLASLDHLSRSGVVTKSLVSWWCSRRLAQLRHAN